jgi:hypothetical protein
MGIVFDLGLAEQKLQTYSKLEIALFAHHREETEDKKCRLSRAGRRELK